MSELADAAIKLADAGVRVFPCGPDKAPRTPNGYYDATTNLEIVKAWDWAKGMIGAPVPPGTVIIDVDPRNGGSDTMKLLRENGKQLPKTKTARTKSGGFHYYLSVPEDIVLRGRLGPGVDVKRAGKGYVIVPPSPGYAWISDGQADAPEWLLDELRVEEHDGPEFATSEPKFFPFEDGTPYGMAALEREVGRLLRAPEGERNETLNKAAFALSQLCAGGEISRQRAVKDLVTAAGRMGLSMQEAQGTISSGWKAGEKVPRQARLKAEAVNAETLVSELPQRSSEESDEEREARFWVNWEVDEPPPPFILHPLIPKNAYILVYGATEASKSMVWNALLAEASRRGFRASVYSLENPPSTDRDRLRRLRPNPENFRLTNEPLDLNDARQLEMMAEREKDWGDGRGTDIVLIDTYSHAFNSRSEDGNAKAIEFARRVRHVMHETGCTVIVVDHTGYAQDDEPRDASAKRQQVDVALLMKKNGDWRPGQPSRFQIENKKAARFANPCFLQGAIVDTDGDIRGLELRWESHNVPEWENAG